MLLHILRVVMVTSVFTSHALIIIILRHWLVVNWLVVTTAMLRIQFLVIDTLEKYLVQVATAMTRMGMDQLLDTHGSHQATAAPGQPLELIQPIR